MYSTNSTQPTTNCPDNTYFLLSSDVNPFGILFLPTRGHKYVCRRVYLISIQIRIIWVQRSNWFVRENADLSIRSLNCYPGARHHNKTGPFDDAWGTPLLTPSINFSLLFISLYHASQHVSEANGMIIPIIYYNCNYYSGTAVAFVWKRLSDFIYVCIKTAKG